jgi:hypothetical protein
LFIEFDVEWTAEMMQQWESAFSWSNSFIWLEGPGSFGQQVTNQLYISALPHKWQDQTGLNTPVTPLPDGRGTHHIKFSRVGTNWQTYIDGVLCENFTYTPAAPTDTIIIGYWSGGSSYYTPFAGTHVYINNIKIGTTDGGTEIASANFDDGTFGTGLTPDGYPGIVTPSIVRDADYSIEKPTAKFHLTPRALESPTNRAILYSPDETDSYLEHVLTTPVDPAGSLYGKMEIWWRFQDSIQYGNSPQFIQLLDSTNAILASVYVYSDNAPNMWTWYVESISDARLEWDDPELVGFQNGDALISFALVEGQIVWTIGEHTFDPQTMSGTVEKIRFGNNAPGNSPMSVFIDNLQVGHTDLYELFTNRFETASPGASLTEHGTVEYTASHLPGPPIMRFDATASREDAYAWLDLPSPAPYPLYIEFDVSWTALDEAAWGSFSGYPILFLGGSYATNWVEYIYHDVDGWYDNASMFISDPLTGAGGKRRVKIICTPDNYHIIIDNTDGGVQNNTGTFQSIQLGWGAGSNNLGGNSLEKLTIGTTNGGGEIYDYKTDRRNLNETFLIKQAFSYGVGAIDYTDSGSVNIRFTPLSPTSDVGSVKLHFTPLTTHECVGAVRPQFTANTLNRWNYSAFNRWYNHANDRRWTGEVSELPVPVVC